MSAAAIAMLLASAGLHTAWNALLKRVGEKQLVTWWIIATGGVLSLAGLMVVGPPRWELWPFIAGSIAAEVAYFWTLARGYSQHDFSLIYPVARGAAPAITAVSAVFFLGERPSPGGFAGLALIVAGLLIIGASQVHGSESPALRGSGLATGLLIALFISAYTIVDGAAVRQGTVAPYALTVFSLMPLPAAPIMLRGHGWQTIWETFITEKARILLISLLGIGSYLLALTAFRIAPLNYSAAIRESSVVMGAFVGWRCFSETLGRGRVAGALVVFCGILLISLAG